MRESGMITIKSSPNLIHSSTGSLDSFDDGFPTLSVGRISILSLLSGLIWLAILNFGSLGSRIGAVLTAILLLISLVLLAKGQTVNSLVFLAYLAILEPAIRLYISFMPYLILEYLFIIWVTVALLKYKTQRLQAPAVFYLLYLIIEVLGAFDAFNFELARSILVSSMTIGFALLLLNKLDLGKRDLSQLFTAIIIGVATLMVIIGYSYVTKPIEWGSQSNFSASGGMGPVQTSMLLGLGASIFLLLADRVGIGYRLVYIVFAGAISIMMVLTFSRNGLYLTAIVLLAYYILFSRLYLRTVLIFILLSILGLYIFEFATQVAGPSFVARYSDTNTTGRDLLITYGWKMFLDNPFWGVGTSNFYVVVAQTEYYGRESGAHNELIRAAAEHGIWGLSTWLLFFLSSTWLGFRQFKDKTRALRMALLLFFFAYLAVNGIKLLIQPIILLIALSANEF